MRRRTARIASLTFASGLALSPLALFGPASAAEEPESQQFTTVGTNNFVVPDDITCVQFEVDAASGGDGEGEGGADGGNGGRVSGWYESTPGENLSIQVGGRGGDGSTGGNGGIGGTLGIAGGDGGEYNDALDPEPERDLTGGGGGGGSALVAGFIIATAGAGGGGGAGPAEGTQGGGGGNGDVGGDPGAGPGGGLGGPAGESVSGIGDSADVLGDPPDGEFDFFGGGGGGGGGNGGGAGGSVYSQLISGAGGGGGGGWNFFSLDDSVINVSESTAPAGNGQITLTWQEGFTGDCGDDWDPVDGGGGDGDGDDSNVGSTFDTGVTPSDSSNLLPAIGLVEGALIATVGAIVLVTTRRRMATSSDEEASQ